LSLHRQLAVFAAAWTAANAILAGPTGKEEAQMKDTWFRTHLTDATSVPPFSFTYHGQPSAKLLAAWTVKVATERLDEHRTRRTSLWTDPKTGLEVRCVAVDYADYPAEEWTVWFRNTGANTTPILENIQGLDARFERGEGGEFVLHGIKGDSNTPDSYQPYEIPLPPGANHRFAPKGGRASNGAFPYYNLQSPGGGILLAIGWPGQWATSFTRDAANGVRIVAGQELTRLVLKPGETVRTPLIAMLFWEGSDRAKSQNLWRRWMIAHNLPRTADGKPPVPIYIFCSGGFFPGLKVSEAGERQFIDVLSRERIPIDYWWMDAGWYPCNDWPQVGTWEPDVTRFPAGIKAVSDYVRARGLKLILWFEPERVTGGSWIATKHPDWVLGGALLNLGNPEARTWLTDHVDRLIREQGIDLYRQDFNMDPLDFWRKNDVPGRQGITENLHVQGYLAYWDELRRRHPGMLIDSCASGGRRNDLETMRRAVPLLRSDYQAFDGNPAYAAGNQGHTYGLSSWLPYYGHGVYRSPRDLAHYVRSHMSPSFGFCVDVRKPGIDWNQYRGLVDEWRQMAPCMLGDYYPLTPYSLAADHWIAWQFNRPEQGDGVVQVFRRDQCMDSSLVCCLRGLDPATRYEVKNFDDEGATKVLGKDLMEKGLTVEVKDKPGAAVIVYRRVQR
jgi:alpha-galactosidase